MPIIGSGVQVQPELLVHSGGAVLGCAVLVRIFDSEAHLRGGEQFVQHRVGE
jgi:hypothetical protein